MAKKSKTKEAEVQTQEVETTATAVEEVAETSATEAIESLKLSATKAKKLAQRLGIGDDNHEKVSIPPAFVDLEKLDVKNADGYIRFLIRNSFTKAQIFALTAEVLKRTAKNDRYRDPDQEKWIQSRIRDKFHYCVKMMKDDGTFPEEGIPLK